MPSWQRTWQARRCGTPSISTPQLDFFFTSTLCGRLIRYNNLSTNELNRLYDEASASLKLSSFDCEIFLRPVEISAVEETFPLAFTILLHSHLDQFDFLLRTIYRKHNHYCIHVDLKAPLSLYRSIKRRSKCVSNLYLIENRINVTWGEFSVLEAEHICQKELLKRSSQWKYYFNLANTDFPLKTNAELVHILKLYQGQNDITSLPYIEPERQQNRILPNSIPLPLYKGEFHVTLARSTVEYIHSNQQRINDLYEYLNGTDVPDEHFYSIINRLINNREDHARNFVFSPVHSIHHPGCRRPCPRRRLERSHCPQSGAREGKSLR